LDSAGGGTEYVFHVRPEHKIQRHDMNWGSRISALVGNGNTILIKEAAENYWKGVPSIDPLWEYLTPSAIIIDVEEF